MKNGFTLVEVLLVLFVVGLLSTLSLNSYKSIQIRAKERTLIALISSFQLSLESYYLLHSSYPAGSNISIERIEDLLIDNGDLVKKNKNPFTGHYFSSTDPSGLCLYSYFSDSNHYYIEVYGYLNEDVILILE